MLKLLIAVFISSIPHLPPRSTPVTELPYVRRGTYSEFARKSANLATFDALKFGFGNVLFFGLLLKTLMATLCDFSVYFVVSKLLVLAYFRLKMKNERIFSLKFVGILKSVKILEFPDFLKFLTS